MGKHCIIFLEKRHTSVHEAVEQNRLGVKDFRGDMVYDREIIPKDIVEYAIYGDIVLVRDFRRMSDLPCKGSVPAMDAECIHLTLTCSDKMPYTFMSGVKESLPVKRTALEYDSYAYHALLNNLPNLERNLYTFTENAGHFLLYSIILRTCPGRNEKTPRSLSSSMNEYTHAMFSSSSNPEVLLANTFNILHKYLPTKSL